MTDSELHRLTYNMVLEIHREWPELKGEVIRLGRRVTVLEERDQGDSYPPGEDVGEEVTQTGHHAIVPIRNFRKMMRRYNEHRLYGTWLLIRGKLISHAVTMAITGGALYVAHHFWH